MHVENLHLDSEEPYYELMTKQCIMTSVVMDQISVIFHTEDAAGFPWQPTKNYNQSHHMETSLKPR